MTFKRYMQIKQTLFDSLPKNQSFKPSQTSGVSENVPNPLAVGFGIRFFICDQKEHHTFHLQKYLCAVWCVYFLTLILFTLLLFDSQEKYVPYFESKLFFTPFRVTQISFGKSVCADDNPGKAHKTLNKSPITTLL